MKNLFRHFRKSLDAFLSGGIASLSAVIAVAFAVFVWVLVSYLLGYVNSFAFEVYSKVGIVAFVNDSVTEAAIPEIERDIKAIEGVKKVVYVSPEEALKEFEQSLGAYGDIASDLPYNPIPPSFEVYVESPAYLSRVGEALRDMGVFDDVLVPSDFALKLTALMESTRRFIYSIMLLFVFMSFVMIFLTISASVSSHRDEIEVYRYMGASLSYIYAPFVLLGFLYGVVGSAVGVAFALFAASVLKPHIENLSQVIFGIVVKPSSEVWVAAAVALLIGLGVALAATALSVRRFTAELEVNTL